MRNTWNVNAKFKGLVLRVKIWKDAVEIIMKFGLYKGCEVIIIFS